MMDCAPSVAFTEPTESVHPPAHTAVTEPAVRVNVAIFNAAVRPFWSTGHMGLLTPASTMQVVFTVVQLSVTPDGGSTFKVPSIAKYTYAVPLTPAPVRTEMLVFPVMVRSKINEPACALPEDRVTVEALKVPVKPVVHGCQ